MGVRLDGFDELRRQLEDMGRKAEELHGDNEVPADELFTPAFLRAHSEFGSFDDMLKTAFVPVPSDLDELKTNQAWLSFIASRTDFESWDAMCQSAVHDYLARQLGFTDDGDVSKGLGD